MTKYYMALSITFLLQGCISMSETSVFPEVLLLKDGSHKIFTSHPSKMQVVKTSKGMMRHTCQNDSDGKYTIIEEKIEQTGQVTSDRYKSSTVTILGVSKTESEYSPTHMFEGEFHFKCK